MGPMSVSKAWTYCPLDLKAASRIKCETEIVSDATSLSPAHPAQNVPGEEPTLSPITHPDFLWSFCQPCPEHPPTAYLLEDWHSFSLRLCWLHILEPCFPPCGQKPSHNCSSPANRGAGRKRGLCLGQVKSAAAALRLTGILPSPLHSCPPLGLPSRPSACFPQLHSKCEEEFLSTESDSKGRKRKWPVPWGTWELSFPSSGS